MCVHWFGEVTVNGWNEDRNKYRLIYMIMIAIISLFLL